MLKNWAVQKRTESSLLTSGKDAMETLERQAFLRKYNNDKWSAPFKFVTLFVTFHLVSSPISSHTSSLTTNLPGISSRILSGAGIEGRGVVPVVAMFYNIVIPKCR